MQLDTKKLEALLGRVAGELAAAMGTPLVVLGDELGLFKALAQAGPSSPAELAGRTRCAERYVREWLCAQAAAGYVEYDAGTERFSMSPEQAAVFANENGPAFFPAAFEMVAANVRDAAKVRAAFKTGQGIGWHEHDPGLFRGFERFFRTVYGSHLLGEWIPALEGVKARLEEGAKVADVGCGHGVTTVMMARAFPHSAFIGFDYHPESVERARQAAREAKVSNAAFEVATAKSFSGSGYDLVAFFDCLHDMGDPVGAARYACRALRSGGTLLLVEPNAGDRLEDNLNPIGRLFYAASTLVCTPCSLAQEVGLALGTQAGEKRLREVITEAGFRQFRRAAATPFNLVFEARP